METSPSSLRLAPAGDFERSAVEVMSNTNSLSKDLELETKGWSKKERMRKCLQKSFKM